MANKSDYKVHLDHLIRRESLRWVETRRSELDDGGTNLRSPVTKLSYADLDDKGDRVTLFPLLRKPDFQRETSAWSTEDCVRLLESIVSGFIIPSLIVWKSPQNNFLYILDGAHRVSVIRAWILDDWGDKADEDYYERHEYSGEIKEAAKRARELVKVEIGSYEDFVRAGQKYISVSRSGSPRDELSEKEFKRGLFYTDILQGAGFHVQEVGGNYEIAEASFLRINRSGQPLDDWETTLIENRNSSLARAVMSVAHGGSGRFWPDITSSPVAVKQLEDIKNGAAELHKMLFVPPLQTPIKDANVPFIASTRYFPKHTYLLELFPLIKGTGDVGNMFQSDKDAEPDVIIQNGWDLINRTSRVFQHMSGASNDPLSLSLVPLFYFYTKAGRYVRSSLYGFIAWLMAGSDDEIRTRKTLFSAHRGRFEEVVFDQDIAGAITRRIGSGVRAISGSVQFYQELLELLVRDRSEVGSELFQNQLKGILEKLTAPRTSKAEKGGRKFDDTQKATINVREIFKSAIRCEICGGVLDLRRGVQYDHKIPFAQSQITESAGGRPTHPFCNNQRETIENYRAGRVNLSVPALRPDMFVSENNPYQLSFFHLLSKVAFPDDNPNL